MAHSDEDLTTKELLRRGPIGIKEVWGAIRDPYQASGYNPEYLKFLEKHGKATIGEMDTPYHYDKHFEEYVQFPEGTEGIGNLARDFTLNKRNEEWLGTDYNSIQSRLDEHKDFTSNLLETSAESASENPTLANIFALNSAQKIDQATIFPTAATVPIQKTLDTGYKMIGDLAHGDATLLAETALKTAGISVQFATNIASGLMPHEIAMTVGAMGGIGRDEGEVVPPSQGFKTPDETYWQNLGNRLYDQWLTTQVPGFGEFDIHDTRFFKGAESIIMTDAERKAFDESALDTGTEGLAITAFLVNPYGLTTKPLELAMKIPKGIYKGMNRARSMVQINKPLEGVFKDVENKIKTWEQVHGKPITQEELKNLKSMMVEEVMRMETSILGGIPGKNKKIFDSAITKDMQQYLLHQINRRFDNYKIEQMHSGFLPKTWKDSTKTVTLEKSKIDKDTRTINQRKIDTREGTIMEYETASSKNFFKTDWKNISARDREYLRKHNYPGSFSELVDSAGYKVANNFMRKNNIVLPYQDQWANATYGKNWKDLSHAQQKWAFNQRNKDNIKGLADDATFETTSIGSGNVRNIYEQSEAQDIFHAEQAAQNSVTRLEGVNTNFLNNVGPDKYQGTISVENGKLLFPTEEGSDVVKKSFLKDLEDHYTGSSYFGPNDKRFKLEELSKKYSNYNPEDFASAIRRYLDDEGLSNNTKYMYEPALVTKPDNYFQDPLKESYLGQLTSTGGFKLLKDKMFYQKYDRNNKLVNVTTLHRAHPLQHDWYNAADFPQEFIELVNRPTYITSAQKNMKLTPEIENVLIPNIQKVDKIKVQIDEMAQAGKTDTQKFKRLKTEMQKLDSEINRVANLLAENGLYIMYPSFGKLKIYGKEFDNLMQVYKDYKALGGARHKDINKPPSTFTNLRETEIAPGQTIKLEEKAKGGLITDPKRGAVTGPGSYAGEEYDPETLFGKFLTVKSQSFEDQRKFDALPRSMKGPMALFLEDEARYQRVREAEPEVRYKTEKKWSKINLNEIKKTIAEELTDAKPVRWKWSNIPEAIQQNPLIKSLRRQQQLPFLMMAAIGNDIKNSFKGTDQEFYENFPTLSSLVSPSIERAWSFTPGTDDEAAYIDGFAEINRALETGITNLGFNTMDLVLGGIDLAAFGKTDLSSKLRESYDKLALNEPETFLGDMVSLLVEFGVPGGLVTKILTRAQKALRIKGVNTMTRFIDDDVYGAARLGMQMSNISKKMGTGAIIFGATDLLAGGPYNSLHRMFPEDPTLLPGKPIDTTDLTGNELALANMKNRVRFGADGAMIGGLFPLLGPAAWAATKWTAKLPFKTIPGIDRSVVGGALQIAGIPLKIAADTLAGKLAYTNKTLPVIGEGIQKLGQLGAKGIQETAKIIGKQVFTRAALGAYDIAFAKQAAYSGIKFDKTFKRSLPDFQKWREFSVNSQDPLHQYLARIDNKLAAFRDIGKLTKDAFGISGQTSLFIKAKSRAIDKYLKAIEQEAYKMAKVFEDRHKNWGEYQTIQRKYLDDVLDYLQGNVKADALPLRLRQLSVELKEYTNGLKKEFGELLPDSDPLKYLLSSNIDKYMRRSFSMFTNSDFQPGREAVMNAKEFVKDVIRGNDGFMMMAKESFPDQPIAKAIDEYAELKVADIMHTARYEIDDPFKALEKIVNKKLGLEDIRIKTGEEVPAAIRKLLGEEKNLKSSLLQTTGNMIASTQQKTALDRLAKMGLENGWLFNTAEEALTKGKIYNAARLTDVKGTGFLLNDAIGLYGTPEMVRQLSGYSIFDSALKYKVYQNLLAFKAMVQGGKTLYSPATQMRNFGSASLFAMNVGHIGGSASVPQAMKIVLDDIFGSGPKVNRKDLIKYIERKVELGVTDENVVANELAGILADLKGTRSATGEPIISSFNQLLQKVGNTQLSQYVQRTYAGGDNVWKIYGHEFYMSELKQFTKSIDDVKAYFKNIIGREFEELSTKTGVKKTLAEGIEEMGAYLVRETYPTYSRVPPVVQAIRKLPIGNFISFPAEMLRTSATTLSLSLKHIASGNPGLQAMGYRSLFGQFTTLYGMNEALKQTGHYLTNINPEMTAAYLDELGPSFMRDHALVPLTNQDKKTGMFKAFDLSTYNPYAYVIDPVQGFIRELNSPRLISDIDGEVFNRIFDAASPLMALLEPFTTEAIALEPILDIWARQGRSRDGSIIFSPSDDFGEKVEKSWNHILATIAPGFIRSSAQVLDALSLDTKGGRVMELGDVLIRLLGGSIMNVDPVAALDYEAVDIREIRSNAFKTEHFFSKENALERGPDVMAAEFIDIQNETLASQFEVWKMFQQSLSSGLLTKRQIEKVLGADGRNVPNLDNLLDGKFTPVSFSEDALRKRANEIYNEYKRNGIIINKSDLKPFSKLRKIIRDMEKLKFKDLMDQSRDQVVPSGRGDEFPTGLETLISQNQTPVAPLPNIPTPDVSQVNLNQGADPQTGLTRTETALLSPSEKIIQQRQRGTV